MKAHAYQLNFYEMYTCSRRRFRILNIDMSRSVYIISKSQSVRDRPAAQTWVCANASFSSVLRLARMAKEAVIGLG